MLLIALCGNCGQRKNTLLQSRLLSHTSTKILRCNECIDAEIKASISLLHPYINENIECGLCSLQIGGAHCRGDDCCLLLWKKKILHECCIYAVEKEEQWSKYY